MFPRFSAENFDKNMELVKSVERLAEAKGCTAGQIAINWILEISKRPGMPRIIPIPGSSNPDRIRENATRVELTADDMAQVDKILKEFVPAGDRYAAGALSLLDA